MPNGKPVKKRCPSCGKQPYQFREVWEGHSILFELDKQGEFIHEGILEDGHPAYVQAICVCGHCWRLRGVRQIIDLETV